MPAQWVAGHHEMAGEQGGPDRDRDAGKKRAAEEKRPEGEAEEGRAGIPAAPDLNLGHETQPTLYRDAMHLRQTSRDWLQAHPIA
jgi:hypothetical protein